MKITCQPARTIREFRELLDTDPQEVSFVRNDKDWANYAKGRDCGYHPLEALSDKEMREFDKSLRFGERGIASANIAILQRKLTYSQYATTLGAFGMDPFFAADHEGYSCVGAGNCKKTTNFICIGDNC